MELFGQISNRRTANAGALAAFGISVSAVNSNGLYRTIRKGKSVTLFTIGYERRNGDDLIAALLDAGVQHLADVRDKPVSRKPDFRAASLRSLCEEANIEYGAWSDLGSTEQQRDRLKETGDLNRFHTTFRTYATKHLDDAVERLSGVAKKKVVALMCYERVHEECHRSIVADLVADRLSAGITAIV